MMQPISIIPPCKPIKGVLHIPGSKSYTNRALLMAAVAAGTSRINNILHCDDSAACLRILEHLGVAVHASSITGHGLNMIAKPDEHVLHANQAGTVARFLPGLLAAAHNSDVWYLEASAQLLKRPMHSLVAALQQLGADITYVDKPGYLPLRIVGGSLRGGAVTVAGDVSSQFISGLLMCSPCAKKTVHIVVQDTLVQENYVAMTMALMQQFGIVVDHDKDLRQFIIEPQTYQPANIEIESDVSTACYFFALAALTAGSIRVTNINQHSKQPDIGFLHILETLGCRYHVDQHGIEVVGPAQLRGGQTFSMHSMSDQTMTLAALASFCDAPITITDVAHIRYHESDRLHGIACMLQTLGARVNETPSSLTIYPSHLIGAPIATLDDHRLAMCAALIGCKIAHVQIDNATCVNKTCPTFFQLLRSLGILTHEILGRPAS